MRRKILVWSAVALVLAACGGGTQTGRSPTDATPTLSSSAVRLVGTDPVVATQRMVDRARADLHALTVAKLLRPYNRDSVVEDFGFNVVFYGTTDAKKAFSGNLRDYSGARWTAGYAGQGVWVIEERWDFTESPPRGTIQLIAVATVSGGKNVQEYDSYQMFTNLPKGTPLEPTPLATTPGPADTPAAAQAVALKFAAALQTKDAAAMAALSAPDVAFMDLASSTTGSSPADVQAHYSKMFAAPADLAFTDLRYALGAGWAAVVWTAGSGATQGSGVTMLEIRGGKIARETLYYTSTNVPFG